MMNRSQIFLWTLASIFLLATAGTAPLHAQLISPGELSRVHTNLEGVNNCTNCHQLGQVGISNVKCLDCHTPLESRISESLGFHATVASQNCGDCHKDHFGLDFDVLRFEPESFDHTNTEYPLVGAHVNVDCRSCHQPEFITSTEVRIFKSTHDALDRTWLGLTATCVTCHAPVNVHGDQFGDQDCGTCHTENQWDELPNFNHDQTTFALTGRHLEVSCDGCHKPYSDQPDIVHFADLPASTCASCHNDVHEGQLDSDCGICHITDDWDQFTANFPTTAFNHDLTDFPLIGQHAEATCASCHAKPAPRSDDIQITFLAASVGSTFPEPEFDACLSCHTDSFHDGVFTDAEGGATCDNCHSENGWTPTSFDLSRHNTATTFELTGAHMVTPCFACHQGTPPEFHFENQECQTCHLDSNPHGDQFQAADGTVACTTCHGTESWEMDGTFDHASTRFALTGKHATASCQSCHPFVESPAGPAVQQFTDLSLTCETCHQQDNPHQEQFGNESCQTCHDTVSFLVDAFDHSTTRFPLDGAHEGVACGSCHGKEQNPQGLEFIRYKPLKMECQDCHDNLN